MVTVEQEKRKNVIKLLSTVGNLGSLSFEKLRRLNLTIAPPKEERRSICWMLSALVTGSPWCINFLVLSGSYMYKGLMVPYRHSAVKLHYHFPVSM